ncbi:FtsX-like permease family protein [Roseivirga spongicola]|nr:FtsX-like permease family protein [Roseivirga spongicola]
MKQPTPPRLFQKLLSKMFSNSTMEELEGDLLDDFQRNHVKYGSLRAKIYFMLDVVRLTRLVPRSRRTTQNSKTMNNLFLFNLKYSLRSIKKHRVYQSLNIASLTLGFTCFSLIYLFVYDQHQKDSFLSNPESIVGLNVIHEGKEGIGIHTGIPHLLKKDIPEIEKVSRMNSMIMEVSTTGSQESFTESVLSVEPDFMDIFQIETVLGERFPKEAGTVLISEEMAIKLFTSAEEAMGKEITLTFNNKPSKKHIAGITRNLPVNSSYSAQIIGQPGNYQKHSDLNGMVTVSLAAFFKLMEGTDRTELANRIPETLKAYTERTSILNTEYKFRTLEEIRKNPQIAHNFIQSVDAQTLLIFKIVGFVILLLAIGNYVNLSTALTLKRTQEVGIKHAMGASRKNLMSQLLTESFIVGGISVLFSLLLVLALLPTIETYIGLEIGMELQSRYWLIIISILSLMALVILTSLYPAILFSTTKMSTFLKGKASNSPKSQWVRSSLMVLQFAISTFLIVGSFTFLKQLRFINRSHNLNKLENVIIVKGDIGNQKSIIAQKLNSLPEIDLISFSSFIPGPADNGVRGLGTSDFKSSFDLYIIDTQFLEIMGLRITEGQDFFRDDRNKTHHVLVNQAMIENIKEGHPLGQEYKLYGEVPSQVIGIVEDFPVGSIKSEIEPAMYMQAEVNEQLPNTIKKLAIRLNTNNPSEAIKKIESAWLEVFPDQPFEAEFIDDRIAKVYTDELKMGQLFGIFTGVAILISCLGLVGLLTYLIQTKMKEIGIRKVLGASFSTLARLLTLNIWKVLALASIISFPLSYYFLEDWLTSFVYRTEISAELFVMTLAFFVLIVGITVFWQIRNAVRVNPTEVLRNE